jgi:ribosome-binding protein aMBF1 (putative translation factor)
MSDIAADAVVIFGVFKKQTDATPLAVINACKGRFAEFQRLAKSNKGRAVRKDKQRRLEPAGWKIGDTADFLQLSDEKRRFIETKLALAGGLRRWRENLGLTQTDVAERIGSSQSRVAKMEVADRTVSTDLLLRSLFRLGANRRDVARLLSETRRTHAA